jgi:hypothetical protein
MFDWTQVTRVALAFAWVLSVPLMALAYKAQYGYQPIPMEKREFWYRSFGAGLGLAALGTVLMGLGYLLVHGAELPAWFAYMVVAAFYIPLGVWYLFWMFALEDLAQALGLYFVYGLLCALALTPVVLVIRLVVSR